MRKAILILLAFFILIIFASAVFGQEAAKTDDTPEVYVSYYRSLEAPSPTEKNYNLEIAGAEQFLSEVFLINTDATEADSSRRSLTLTYLNKKFKIEFELDKGDKQYPTVKATLSVDSEIKGSKELQLFSSLSVFDFSDLTEFPKLKLSATWNNGLEIRKITFVPLDTVNLPLAIKEEETNQEQNVQKIVKEKPEAGEIATIVKITNVKIVPLKDIDEDTHWVNLSWETNTNPNVIIKNYKISVTSNGFSANYNMDKSPAKIVAFDRTINNIVITAVDSQGSMRDTKIKLYKEFRFTNFTISPSVDIRNVNLSWDTTGQVEDNITVMVIRTDIGGQSDGWFKILMNTSSTTVKNYLDNDPKLINGAKYSYQLMYFVNDELINKSEIKEVTIEGTKAEEPKAEKVVGDASYIKFTNFTAKQKNNQIILEWTLAGSLGKNPKIFIFQGKVNTANTDMTAELLQPSYNRPSFRISLPISDLSGTFTDPETATGSYDYQLAYRDDTLWSERSFVKSKVVEVQFTKPREADEDLEPPTTEKKKVTITKVMAGTTELNFGQEIDLKKFGDSYIDIYAVSTFDIVGVQYLINDVVKHEVKREGAISAGSPIGEYGLSYWRSSTTLRELTSPTDSQLKLVVKAQNDADHSKWYESEPFIIKIKPAEAEKPAQTTEPSSSTILEALARIDKRLVEGVFKTEEAEPKESK